MYVAIYTTLQISKQYSNGNFGMNAKWLCSVTCSLRYLFKITVDRKTFTPWREVELKYTVGWRPRTNALVWLITLLQANEINRAWMDSVESCQRGICSCVHWLNWYAHIQRKETGQSVLLSVNRAVASFITWSGFTHHCNKGQCSSSQMLAMRSYNLVLTA